MKETVTRGGQIWQSLYGVKYVSYDRDYEERWFSGSACYKNNILLYLDDSKK